jgi:hypothetical protein
MLLHILARFSSFHNSTPVCSYQDAAKLSLLLIEKKLSRLRKG